MKVIHYYCPDSNQYFIGILVKQENGISYIAEVFLYRWLRSLNQLERLPETTLRCYLNDSDFHYTYVHEPNPFLSGAEKSFINFPILTYKTSEFHGISLFFQHYQACEKTTLSFIQRMELCVNYIEQILPDETITDILVFFIHEFGAKEKTRILFSSILARYMKGLV